MDTPFWIALSSEDDQHRDRAEEWAKLVKEAGIGLVTTEAVLWEWLNGMSAPHVRGIAIGGYRACHANPLLEVVPFTSDLIHRATARYRDRPDKGWSITDCLSFVVMEDRNISDALTADRHFEQAGFSALLLTTAA